MKIIYIFNKSEIGGATKSGLVLIKKMKDNYNVVPIVLTPVENGKVEKFCKNNNIECHVIKYKEIGYSLSVPLIKKIIKIMLFPFMFWYVKVINYIYAVKSRNKINYSDVDFVHTNVGRDNFGIIISKIFNIKHIMHLREFGTLDFNCYYLCFNYYKYINDNTFKFIAISDIIKKFYISKGIEDYKIETIYNGIDYDNIVIKSIEDSKNKILKIVTFSGISNEKGQWQIIEALNLLPREILKNIHYYLYGGVSSSYYKKLEKLIKKYQLTSNISFLGYSDNLYQDISKYDLSITSSKSEAFGRVTVECMFAKIPLIVSNSGANTELIDNGITGLVYEFANIEDLKNKILIYYNNRELMKIYANNAYEKAVSKFKADDNCNKVYDLYDLLIKSGENQ